MARYSGLIGFAVESKANGVWKETIVTRKYYGDTMRNTRRLQGAGQVNDNIVVGNSISIVSDPYADENFHAIRYAEFMGTKWKVDTVDVQYPRLILSLGEVYNGESDTTE